MYWLVYPHVIFIEGWVSTFKSLEKLTLFISITHAGVCKPTLVVREDTKLSLGNCGAIQHSKIRRRLIIIEFYDSSVSEVIARMVWNFGYKNTIISS